MVMSRQAIPSPAPIWIVTQMMRYRIWLRKAFQNVGSALSICA